MIEKLKYILDYPVLKEIIIFIILQIITYLIIYKRKILKEDINQIISKIEQKIKHPTKYFTPLISNSTKRKINRADKLLLSEIKEFLSNNLSIETAAELANTYVIRIKRIY